MITYFLKTYDNLFTQVNFSTSQRAYLEVHHEAANNTNSL